MSKTTDEDPDRARRFQEEALPHLDSVYTLARYLLRDAADAEDAVQECYLRALRHFKTLRSHEVKPWLLAILRNVCRVEYGRRARLLPFDVNADSDNAEGAIPFWQEPQDTPETRMLRELDVGAIRALVAALPEPFREVIVLRELEDLSYREIADVVGAPIGTVMSRLARARRDAARGMAQGGDMRIGPNDLRRMARPRPAVMDEHDGVGWGIKRRLRRSITPSTNCCPKLSAAMAANGARC